MFERFTKDARAVTEAAVREAEALGARQVEAEHLLLALAGRGVAGLDRDEIAGGLEAEQRAALAAVGVDLDAFDLPAPRRRSRLRFGASAKAALEGAFKAALRRDDRRITEVHVLLGLLEARHGRVRRALAFAGIDVVALARTPT